MGADLRAGGLGPQDGPVLEVLVAAAVLDAADLSAGGVAQWAGFEAAALVGRADGAGGAGLCSGLLPVCDPAGALCRPRA